MIAYVLRRLLAAVPVLLGVSLVVFSMLHFLPGDPVLLMMSETGGSGAKMAEMSQETYERIRHELGTGSARCPSSSACSSGGRSTAISGAPSGAISGWPR